MPTSRPDITDEAIIKAFAAKLGELLAERDWSLRELSRRSGVSPMLLSDLANGKRAITLTSAVQIAEAFGVSVAVFCPFSGNEP